MLGTLLVALALSSSGAIDDKFEVASVKPSDPNVRGGRITRTAGNGLVAVNMTLRALVLFAYDVPGFQVSGGPGWQASEHFDIVAKPATGDDGKGDEKADINVVRARTRALLAERFGLVVHRESKELASYELGVGKNGPKMKATSGEGDGITRDRGVLTGSGAEMNSLSRVLVMIVGRPVVDRTGLTAKYDFKLEWADDGGGGLKKDGTLGLPTDPAGETAGPSIFTALQEQLGLKLESTKAPVEMVIIDKAEKPTAN